jgi:hypothetical protein
MPVFLTGRNPHNVAFADLLGSTAPLPNPACASRHNQRLSEGVREPALSGAAERLAARVQAGELDCQARPTAAALGSAPRSHPQSRPDTARQWEGSGIPASRARSDRQGQGGRRWLRRRVARH